MRILKNWGAKIKENVGLGVCMLVCLEAGGGEKTARYYTNAAA
jgi:hypothetical protein